MRGLISTHPLLDWPEPSTLSCPSLSVIISGTELTSLGWLKVGGGEENLSFISKQSFNCSVSGNLDSWITRRIEWVYGIR